MPTSRKDIQIDSWVWGREQIIWGFDPAHRYTFKILEPKQGRAGCMSLQYHHEKSESWLMLRGELWTLFIVDGEVCTKIMRPGDVQNISPGMVHRMAGITADVQVAEPSTPDRHAADKHVKKDVVRLHCVFGRPCEPARDADEEKLLRVAVERTEEALAAIERGEKPKEYNPGFLKSRGAHHIVNG